MAIALTPHATREFILARERSLPADQQTRFLLRAVPLTVRTEFLMLLGLSAADGEQTAEDLMRSVDPGKLSRLYVLALRTSLVGWRNFRDAEGREAPFATEPLDVNGVQLKVPTVDTIELLAHEDFQELGTESLNSMLLSRTDAKN